MKVLKILLLKKKFAKKLKKFNKLKHFYLKIKVFIIYNFNNLKQLVTN